VSLATRAPAEPIRLIAIDIDGTLLDSAGQIPEANLRAIHAAADRGVEVVLATGRTFHHAVPVARKLKTDVVLMVSNGALVKTPDGETLATRLVPREIARDLILDTRPVREGAALIFDRTDAGQYVWERVDWSHPQRAWYYERNRVYMTELAELDHALGDAADDTAEVTWDAAPVQVAFTGAVTEMRTLAAHVRGLPYTKRLTLTLTEYEDRDFSLFDVTAEGCSKGATLAAWAATRDIRPSEVMAVGDNLNDRDMLAFAGHPVVMGNAVADLKQAGWPTTTSHDRAGLALAITALVLTAPYERSHRA
jgi:Cof subfamily protein (haloacid dehalogenase superfamily)